MDDLNSAERFLDEFKDLPPRVEPTFLQIAGYAHYELVCSNLLRFFFDPNEIHGFGFLFLEALLADEGRELADVEVEREFPAGTKALDLVIRSSTHLIGIENKIHAKPDNDFGRYSAALAEEANGREVPKFLLTLHSVHNQENLAGFQPITYDTFLKSLRSLIAERPGQGDARYKIFLMDFINTIERLESGSSAMTKEQHDFFAKRESEINNLLNLVGSVKGELREKVLELKKLIEVRTLRNVKQRPDREDKYLQDMLIHEIEIGQDWRVRLDAVVSASGWDLWLYAQPGRKATKADLNKLLDRCGIRHKQDGDPIPGHFDYDDLELVSRNVQEIVDKIAKPAARRAGAR